ncbi:MAG: ATP-binding protein [Spirochaetes bacterium]|nr:ATP-binding protein [Spirochaetota bacterium]
MDELANRILQNISSGVIVFNSELKVIFFNKSVNQYFTVQISQGIILGDIHPFFSQIKKSIEEWIELSQAELKYYHIYLDQSENQFYDIKFQQLDEEDQYLLTIENVTKTVLKEKYIQIDEKLSLASNLARKYAHDFNNVLLALDGTLFLLNFDLDGTETIETKSIKEPLAQIEAASNRAKEMIGQLNLLSREQMQTNQDFDLVVIIQQLIQSHSENFQCQFDFQNHTNEPAIIFGDQKQVHLLLANILKNACEAVENPDQDRKIPCIQISIALTKVNSEIADLVSMMSDNSFYEISITDEGKGIALKDISKIFEPFYTSKQQKGDIGLGLTKSFNLLKSHNGFLAIDNQAGKGIKVSLFLPVKRKD